MWSLPFIKSYGLTMENSMEALQKTKNRMPYDPAIPLEGYI
jgi:hypothetical protein